MRYYEVTFSVEPDTETAKDIVTMLAGEAGFESFDIENKHLKGYVQTDLFDRDMLDNLLADFPMPDVKVNYELKEAEYKNWNETWEQQGFNPITIGNRCIIYDAKKEKPTTIEGQLSIAIEAKQAFGTGTHETTQMIVNELLHTDLKGKRVLDCGCGTGILAIVAGKCGAKDIIGYDIDEWSVENAQHNARLNHIEMEVLEGDVSVLSHISGVFDVIMANINRNILLAGMESFVDVMNTNSTLIMSGFYSDDIPLLMDKAESLGLTLKKRKENGLWNMLVFVR